MRAGKLTVANGSLWPEAVIYSSVRYRAECRFLSSLAGNALLIKWHDRTGVRGIDTPGVVPRPSVNTWHVRVPSAAGCCGVFLAPTALRLENATMALRWVPTQLSGASRQCGPNLWAIALLSLARRMLTSIISYCCYPTNATSASIEVHTIHCIQARYRQEVHISNDDFEGSDTT